MLICTLNDSDVKSYQQLFDLLSLQHFLLVIPVYGLKTLLRTAIFNFTFDINGRPTRCFATSFALVLLIFVNHTLEQLSLEQYP